MAAPATFRSIVRASEERTREPDPRSSTTPASCGGIPPGTADVADIERLLAINLAGPSCCARGGAQHDDPGPSRIVRISSIVSVSGYKGTAAYFATKGGLNAMTRALARELRGARHHGSTQLRRAIWKPTWCTIWIRPVLKQIVRPYAPGAARNRGRRRRRRTVSLERCRALRVRPDPDR
jgi:hypothetical protein